MTAGGEVAMTDTRIHHDVIALVAAARFTHGVRDVKDHLRTDPDA